MNQEPEIRTENPLGYAPLPTLLRRFAVPSIIAMLVSSLYNIVDQFFIGQGVGYLGNAATNVVWGLLYDGTGWVDAIASRVVVWDIIRSGTVV